MFREGGVFADGFARRASFSYQFRLAGERFFRLGFFPRPGGRKFILRSRGTQENSNARDFCTTAKGAGLFHFSADPKYQQEMKSLGFERIDGDKQWAMAIHDVSLKFAQDIKAQNLQGLDTDKLIAFKIFTV